MTSLRAWKILFKALKLWVVFKLLRRRNRPLKILKYPDKRLQQVCEHVDFEKTTVVERNALAAKLASTILAQPYGQRLGIAAPQVGISKRVMIVLGRPMFNPEWTPVKNLNVDFIEGCYSLEKDDTYLVTRAKYGWAKWYDAEGKFHQEKLNDLKAIVFQHELSHLDGKCCNELGEKVNSHIIQSQ